MLGLGLDPSTRRRRGGFTPAAIPGLSLWLRSDSGAEEAAGDAAEANDAVLNWLDRSGNANHAAAAVAANRPTYRAGGLNGLPYLEFAGGAENSTGDWMICADHATLDLAAVTTVMVISNLTVAQTGFIQKGGGTGGASGNYGWRITTGNVAFIHYTSGGDVSMSQDFDTNGQGGQSTPTFLLSAQTATTQRFRTNDTVTTATSSRTQTANAQPLYIGRTSANGIACMTCRLYEVLVYDHVLTTEEETELFAYLAARYS